jgi:hypothetical protein
MNRTDCHTDQGFIESFCSHSMTRYGLCNFCGAITAPGMHTHIKDNYRAGDCPWCAYGEPDCIYNGSAVDWHCLKMSQECAEIRGGEREGMDCPAYWPRKVIYDPAV